MATLTIKIESEDLAREVLAHLNYLPEDQVPDLISVDESDSDGNEEIQKMAHERDKKEREELEAEKDKIRKEAMDIENENDRFNYIIPYCNSELRCVRNAAMEMIFEFLANRNLDPLLIARLVSQSETLLEKLYQYKESDFIIKFKKENGI